MIFGSRAGQMKFRSGNIGFSYYIPILIQKIKHYWKSLLKAQIEFMNYTLQNALSRSSDFDVKMCVFKI